LGDFWEAFWPHYLLCEGDRQFDCAEGVEAAATFATTLDDGFFLQDLRADDDRCAAAIWTGELHAFCNLARAEDIFFPAILTVAKELSN
jgi:hypothetical protein